MAALALKEILGDWYPILYAPLFSTTGKRVGETLARDSNILEPKIDLVFRAFNLTQPKDVKVVILGQDPYPGGHADGLAFSSGIDDIPYSLSMIYRDMAANGMQRDNPSLEDWAKQGVLLINACLTTLTGHTNAHKDIGWQTIVRTALKHLAVSGRPMVWIAWGSFAQSMMSAVLLGEENQVLTITGAHPAAVKHGYIFKGGKHMLIANEFLTVHGRKPILWTDSTSMQLQTHLVP